MKTPRARALQERRAALRARLNERKAAARAELARRRAGVARPAPRRKRRWWWLLLLLLLLLLWQRCRCDEAPVVPPPEPPVDGPVAGGEGSPANIPPPPPSKVNRKSRPAYAPEDPGPLPWIGALRLQVAARSPRLAACFVGTARPGALKWTAAVEPGLGRVSDQELEPLLQSEPLTRAQRDCAFAVLSEPIYRLEGGGDRSTPARVGLVIEF